MTRSRTTRTSAPLIMAVLSLMVFTTRAEAQIGLRGGMNLSKFVGGDAPNSETTKRLNAGGSFSLIHIGPVSLVPEVYYSQKGARELASTLTNPGTTPVPTGGTTVFGLDYIEIPVLAKISFPLARLLNGYVTGGPAYAWNVDCSIQVTDAGATPPSNDCSQTFGSFKSAMQKADLGAVAGLGLDFRIPHLGGLNLDARLVRGLRTLTTGTAGTDIKNQTVSLMLGYYLGAPR